MNKLLQYDTIQISNVRIKDKFWSPYMKLIREVVIPYQWEALNDRVEGADPSHSIENFKIAAGLSKGEFYGMVFQDSDVSKWLEAVGYYLQTAEDKKLEGYADEVIDIIEKAQQEDGYLNTYFTIKEKDSKWTNLAECHELYCAGHFIEAAVAYFNATGKEKILHIACKLADCIDNTFGVEEHKLHGYDGHEEIELALVKLYRTVGEERYLKLSQYFLDERGKEPFFFEQEWEKRGKTNHWSNFHEWNRKYYQAHLPVREQASAEGHSVRLVYLCMAMADVAGETGDKGLYEAAKALWGNIIGKRMYVTGGIGSTHIGEAFTFDYDLPNDMAYNETCASIGLGFFAQRMLKIEAKGEYGDILEKVLYNNIISGISLDGKKFFYVNPLEVLPEASEKNPDKFHVKSERQKWFGCSCCPPNVTRTLASIGQFIYTYNESEIFQHLYVGGESKIELDNNIVNIKVDTNYPWEDVVSIQINPENDHKLKFKFGFRVPGWCSAAKVSLNGETINIKDNINEGYGMLDREWEKGDKLELVFPMTVRKLRSNPKVRNNVGKAALQRGPIVYCLEEADNGPMLNNMFMRADTEFEYRFEEKLLGGVGVIDCTLNAIDEEVWGDKLYTEDQKPRYIKRPARFIPYYSWANRTMGEMQVWIREVE